MWLACVALAVLRGSTHKSTPLPGDVDAAASVQYPPVQVDCDGRSISFPSSMVLIGGRGLWCPNAKVATTSIWELLLAPLGLADEPRCYNRGCTSAYRARGLELVGQVPESRHWQLCQAYSFTFVRNPWDRVRSAFADKVAENYRNKNAMTFPNFVRGISRDPDGNIHWEAYDERCHTSSFQYSFVGKLEDEFDSALKKVFTKSGIAHFLTHPWESSPERVLASMRSNSTAATASEADAAVAAALASLDARGIRQSAFPTVPHSQNSSFSSGLHERKSLYLNAKGLRYPTELVDLVASTYATDIAEFGYSFDA